MERKRTSSSKCPKKQHSQKKKYKGSTPTTRSMIYSPNNSDLSNSSISDLSDPGAIADDKRSKKAPSSSHFKSNLDLSNSSSSDLSDPGAIADDKRSKKAPSSSYFPGNLSLSNSSSSDLSDPGAIAYDKRLKKAPCSPPTLPNSTDLSESGSTFPFPNLIQVSKGDKLHKKDGTKDVCDGSARNTRKKTAWEKYQHIHNERKEIEKRKELRRSKLGDAEKTGKVPNASSKENVAGQKISPMADTKGVSKRSLGNSEVYEKHEKPGTVQVENANKAIGMNKGMSSKDLEKASASMIDQVENTEEAGEKQPLMTIVTSHDDSSNENIAGMKFSPVTAVGKAIPKRRSDPTNALKENRPRTSM